MLSTQRSLGLVTSYFSLRSTKYEYQSDGQHAEKKGDRSGNGQGKSERTARCSGEKIRQRSELFQNDGPFASRISGLSRSFRNARRRRTSVRDSIPNCDSGLGAQWLPVLPFRF